jgi:hypothetical protein
LRNAYTVLVGKPDGQRPDETIGVINLKAIGCESGSKECPVASSSGRGKESFCFVKGGKYLGQWSDCQLRSLLKGSYNNDYQDPCCVINFQAVAFSSVTHSCCFKTDGFIAHFVLYSPLSVLTD